MFLQPVAQDGDITELLTLRVRMAGAQAFGHLMLKAYNALLHHDIHFMELPAYRDMTLLDEAIDLEPYRGQERTLEWIRRVEHEIDAAIRRKGMRRV